MHFQHAAASLVEGESPYGWYVYTGEAARVALLAHFPKRVDHCSVRAFVYAGVVVQQVILDKVVDVAGQTIVFTVPGTAQAFQIARCCFTQFKEADARPHPPKHFSHKFHDCTQIISRKLIVGSRPRLFSGYDGEH